MKKNEAAWDRVLRVIVGAGILSLAFVGPHTPWGYLGIVPIITGTLGFCPAYKLFGFSTCRMKKT